MRIRIFHIVLLILLSFNASSSDFCSEIFDRVKRYETIKLDPYYEGEEEGLVFASRVEYFSKEKSDSYKIYVGDNGLAVDINNSPVNVSDAKYIMDEYGQIAIYQNHITGKIHHSSLSRGAPVAGAGYIVIEDGLIIFLNKHSGHYKPGDKHFNQVLSELKRRKFNLSNLADVLK